MQTAQERVRATGPRQDRTGSHYPPLGWENPPHLSSGASQIPERILGTDPPGGALRGEEENPGRIHVKAGRRSPPRPLPESWVPGASGLPAWVRRTGRAGVGSVRGWQPGRAASAAGRGSRVRRGESLRSGARAASWEFSARRGRRELGLPGEPGTRRGPGPRRRGRRREWEGRRQRRTQPAEEAARGEAEPGQGPERGDQVPQHRGRSGGPGDAAAGTVCQARGGHRARRPQSRTARESRGCG